MGNELPFNAYLVAWVKKNLQHKLINIIFSLGCFSIHAWSALVRGNPLMEMITM